NYWEYDAYSVGSASNRNGGCHSQSLILPAAIKLLPFREKKVNFSDILFILTSENSLFVVRYASFDICHAPLFFFSWIKVYV
ncbi:MAG: hypothetical protein WAU71_05350, partial [Pyrinomonadaceae bacterium]